MPKSQNPKSANRLASHVDAVTSRSSQALSRADQRRWRRLLALLSGFPPPVLHSSRVHDLASSVTPRQRPSAARPVSLLGVGGWPAPRLLRSPPSLTLTHSARLPSSSSGFPRGHAQLPSATRRCGGSPPQLPLAARCPQERSGLSA